MEHFAAQVRDKVEQVQSRLATSTSGKVAVGILASLTTAGLLWKFQLRRVFLANYISRQTAPACDQRLAQRKRKVFSRLEELRKARGGRNLVIIDVGSGNGVNFKYFPEGSEVICVDPNRNFEPFLRAGSVTWPTGVHVSQYHAVYCEHMREDIDPEVADAVIVAGLLCGVPDVDLCLREVHRVLKPGGMLFFLDHVMSPASYPYMRLFQRLMNPLFRFIFGCNINRSPVDNKLRRARFSAIDAEYFEAFELQQPTSISVIVRLIRSRYWGTATK